MDANQIASAKLALRGKWPQGAEQHLRWLVDNTPRGVHDFIHRAYPKEFQLLNKGLERNSFWKGKMYDFLLKQYKVQAAAGEKYAIAFEVFVSQNVIL